MFCEKCESQDQKLLSGVTIGPVARVKGVTKSWFLYECNNCGYYNLLVTETPSEENLCNTTGQK